MSSAEKEITQLQLELEQKDEEIKNLLKQLGVLPGQVSWVWECSSCKEINIDGDKPLAECEFCRQKRPTADKSSSTPPSQQVPASINTYQTLPTNVQPTTASAAPLPLQPKSVFSSQVASVASSGQSSSTTKPTLTVQPAKNTETKWKCESCMSMNIESCNECSVCYADRYASTEGTKLSGEVAGGWRCVACLSLNDNYLAQECSICFADRATDADAWKCFACMSCNKDMHAQVCATCYADRLSDEASTTIATWMCDACMFTNKDLQANECATCYADRYPVPPSSTLIPGWRCQACLSVNANDSADVCNICYADRDERAELKGSSSAVSEIVEPTNVPPVASVTVTDWRCFACRSTNSIKAAPDACMICQADRGWTCRACTSPNDPEAKSCGVCFCDQEFDSDVSSSDSIDISGGKRELLTAERAKELLRLPAQPERVKSIVLKTKSFGAEAARVAARFLRSLPNVEIADLSDIIAGRQTEEALGVLKTMCEALPLTTIKELDLSDNALGERGIRVLEHTLKTLSPKVEVLSFRNNGLSAKSIELLVEFIGAPARLRGLHFYSNMSGDGGAKGLTPLFERIGKFVNLPLEFTMSSCRVQPSGVESLGNGLRYVAKRLVSLDLADSTMGVPGALAVAETIREATQIRKLVLTDPGTEGEALQKLISSIGSLKMLEYLDFSGASLGATNMQLLVQVVQSNCTQLQVLKLAENEGSNKGVKDLLEGGKLPKLRVLDLKSNGLKGKALVRVASLLNERPMFEKLEVCEEEISDETVEELRAILGNRVVISESSD